MSRTGDAYIDSLNRAPEPMADEYLRECEFKARRFQGAWTGTSGDLAARLLLCVQEVYRLRLELAVHMARSSERLYWRNPHD